MRKNAKIIAYNKDHVAVYFCIFVLFLTSMELWIAWNGRAVYINAFIGFVLWALIWKEGIKLNTDNRNLVILLSLFFSFTCLNLIYKNVSGIIGGLFGYMLPISCLVLLNERDQRKCLNYIVKWFAILMIPAMITYLLCQTVGLPSLGTLKLSNNPYLPDWYLYKENYLFCTMYALKETVRFNGPFNEPGHLGMMSAFLLFADGFNFKKKSTWIILLALLVTLSLSGYVLAFVGYMFTRYYQKKMKLKFIILFLVAVLVGYLFANFYNGGDNVINERIVSRLEPDEEKGIAGNNRVRGDIHLYFLKMFNDTKLLLFGYDRETMAWLAENGSVGTGMEMYMVSFGLIGVILSIFFYFVVFFYRNDKKAASLFLTFVILMLLQRSYWYWFSWIICYLYGLSSWDKNIYLKKSN